MATTIVTKYGGDAPAASDIVRGELAVDTENGRLYTENSSGAVVEIGLNPEGNVNVTGNISKTSGDLTIDVAGNIRLDADDNGEIRYLDGGTQYAAIKKDGNNALFQSIVADGDFIIQGIDGASFVSALTLDMSAAGAATFNSTIAAGAATFTTADNNPQLTLISTDADANVGPILKLYRNSASPANNDFLGNIQFVGRNDNSQDVQFAEQEIYITDKTDGAEDGLVNWNVMTNGTNLSYFQLRAETATSVFNEDSNNIDFRVESDGNANMLFVDGGNNRVGIGTGAPSYELVISKDGSSGIEFGPEGVNSTTSFIQFYNRSTAAYDTARIYAKELELFLEAAQVIALDINTAEAVINQSGTDLDFRVESNGNDHMLFVDAGNNRVGVGKTGPNYPLDVANPNAAETTVTAAFRAGGDSDNNRSNIFIGQQENSRGLLIQGGRESGDRAIANFILNGSGGTIGSNIVNFLQAYEVTGSTAFDVTINQDGENIDFKVESQNESQMFVVDASADAVTIGNQRFANTPTSTNNEFIHFSSPQQEVSSNSSTTINLFVRSASGTVVPCCGTVYVSCENSGQNVSWSYIIDFFYSNSTFTTTARATGNSQGTTTCTVQENGAGVSCTVAYTSGLGGNIRFHAGGHASVGNY